MVNSAILKKKAVSQHNMMNDLANDTEISILHFLSLKLLFTLDSMKIILLLMSIAKKVLKILAGQKKINSLNIDKKW